LTYCPVLIPLSFSSFGLVHVLEVVLLTFLRSSSLGLLLKDGEKRMTAGEWLCQRNASRDDQLLACGALIVAELRAAVLQETQFTCSAGIAHNKVLLTYELLFIVKQFAG
jgi:nucleotidyltransferase/DNA polymerase involved in DNA repair